MSEPDPRVLLVEGFNDRAFWRSFLATSFGCTDPTDGGARTVEDGWGVVRGRGEFALLGTDGTPIRVIPGVQRGPIRARVVRVLSELGTRPTPFVVYCPDADTLQGESAIGDKARQLATSADASAVQTGDGGWLIAGGQTRLEVATVGSEPSGEIVGVPTQPCLERLVCAALAQSWPDRAAAVKQWLENLPDPAGPAHKAAAWSYMAGWAPAGGCEFFYQWVWQHGEVKATLEELLQQGPAWAVASRLAGATPAANSS